MGAILRTGLTGGIAAGKTTVANRFAELGAEVIRADEVAHRVVEPDGPAYAAVVARFGDGILGPDGRIERARLARIVFGDPVELSALNALVHPHVREESEQRMERCAREGRAWLVIYDAALLVETGYHRRLDRLVVVRCSPATQVRRLQQRDGMSEEHARARIRAQAPLEDKLDAADYVIDTEGTLEQTREQTDRVYGDLRRDFEQRVGEHG